MPQTQQIPGAIQLDTVTINGALTVQGATTFNGTTNLSPVAPYTVTGAPPANANNGALQVGGGVFGGGAGTFAGNAVGTAIAVNLPSGSMADLFNGQVAGASSVAKIDYTGILTAAGVILGTAAQIRAPSASQLSFTDNSTTTNFAIRNGSAYAPSPAVELMVNGVGPSTSTEAAVMRSNAVTTTITAGFAAQRFHWLRQSTISGAFTVTNAATLAIEGAPLAAGGATLTNSHALWVQAGVASFDGGVRLATNVNFNYAVTAAGSGAAPTLPANTPTGATGGTLKYIAVQIQGATAYLLAAQ